jgi:hypothetical protein
LLRIDFRSRKDSIGIAHKRLNPVPLSKFGGKLVERAAGLAFVHIA